MGLGRRAPKLNTELLLHRLKNRKSYFKKDKNDTFSDLILMKNVNGARKCTGRVPGLERKTESRPGGARNEQPDSSYALSSRSLQGASLLQT